MKNVFRYIIPLVFLFSIVGWYPTFYVLKKSVKREMKQRLAALPADKSCHYFIFSHEQYAALSWVEEHEFRYGGEMYDVLREEMYPEGVLVYCFHDKKDSWLYNELVSQHDPEKTTSGKTGQMKRLLQYVFFVYVLPCSDPTIPDQAKEEVIGIYDEPICDFSPELYPPPPKA